ncbi:hypothetical protein EYF80_017622 [Liparis tanakae]|uniref:Uncharacterized protein n=1 Tax=Liparis tanakae TaxID=230148 RepID=A0A4Z2I4G2_9TELE|nr:hypothetical protein EYF80_017622 [Liparis tanakae]
MSPLASSFWHGGYSSFAVKEMLEPLRAGLSLGSDDGLSLTEEREAIVRALERRNNRKQTQTRMSTEVVKASHEYTDMEMIPWGLFHDLKTDAEAAKIFSENRGDGSRDRPASQYRQTVMGLRGPPPAGRREQSLMCDAPGRRL